MHQLLADFQVHYTNLRGFHWDIYKELKGTPEEEAKLKESYAHLCKLRDEVIGMGVLPAIKDWKSINPNID